MNLGGLDPVALSVGVLLSSAGFSWLITLGVRRLAVRHRLVDFPGRGRKQHARPTPLLGGVAIYGGTLLAIAGLWVLGVLPDAKFTPAVLFAILLGATGLMIGGYVDDRYQLPPGLQIIAPLFGVIVVVLAGVRISVITLPFGGVAAVPTVMALVVTPLWLLLMMYTTKLSDGVDGLVSTLTLVGALIIFAVSLRWDAPRLSTALVALALAGSALGFLPWNISPAKIFLGEGGSVICGFLLGLLAIVSGSKIATTLLVMAAPLLDAIWVVGERLRSGDSPVRADQRHLHYRLLSRGWSPRQVVGGLAAIASIFGLIGIVASPRAKLVALVVSLALVTGLLSWSRWPVRKNGQS